MHFQTLDPTKFLMCSADLNMGTISGTTRIKTIFSFWTGIGKHFIGNALCRSADSVMQLSHTFHILTISNAFHKLRQEKIQRSQIWRTRGTREWVPVFLSNDQGTL